MLTGSLGNEKSKKAKMDVMQVAMGASVMSRHKAFMEKSPFVISPRTWYMRRWDLVTLLLLLFTAIVTPVEVAFMETVLWSVLFLINRSVDCLFIFDIFLNFFVAIVDPEDGQLVFHHPTIVKEYLRGWFWIDVISVMPFDLVSLVFASDGVGKLKILRVLRLLRLMKLLRILRAGRIFQRLETQYQIDYAQLELVKFGILALVTSHWMACSWGILADLEDAEFNWMYYTTFNTYLESGQLVEGQDPRGVVSPMEIYVAAFYWSSMTMTTIGYGDIVPSTWLERVFASMSMLVGAFVYGYIIGAVGNVIAQANEKKNKFYALMGELNSFLSEGKLSPDLRIRLREYFKYKMASSHVDAHTALLQQMSPALRAEITLTMNTWITKVDFFHRCPEALIIELTLSIKQSTFPPQEKILVPGDYCDRMYIVRKGVAICRQKIVTTSQVFCIECLFKESKVTYQAHAVTFCDLYSIERDVMVAALAHFPDVKSHFRIMSLRKIFYDEVIAYSVAYKALEDDGADADVSSNMDDRPAFYLDKLRKQYGYDGAGLREDGLKLQMMKDRAAANIQRVFRGHKARRDFETLAAEAGTVPVFPVQLRSRDASLYSARAIDVLHHRVGTGIYALHQKIDRLLGSGSTNDPEWWHTQGKSGFQFVTEVNETGVPVRRMRSSKGGLAVTTTPVGPPPRSRRLSETPAIDERSEAGTGSGSADIRELRQELVETLNSVRSMGGGSGAFAEASAEASGSLTARTAQLQSLVGDLARQVNTISETVSNMSDTQRTFQERSQRTILGHLEQAQARIADQVARAVAAAGGDSARFSSGTRPPAGVGGMSVDESDPPPVRPAARGDDQRGAGQAPGGRVLQRRPLGGGPPARPRDGFY